MHAGSWSSSGRANIGTDDMAYSTCCPGQLRYIHPKVWRVIPVIFVGLGMTVAGMIGVIRDRQQLAEDEKLRREIYGTAEPPNEDTGNGETWPYAVLGWGIFFFLGSIVYAYSLQRSSMEQGMATRGAMGASQNATIYPVPPPPRRNIARPHPNLGQSSHVHLKPPTQGVHLPRRQEADAIKTSGVDPSTPNPDVSPLPVVHAAGDQNEVDSSLNRTTTNIILVQNDGSNTMDNSNIGVQDDNFSPGDLVSHSHNNGGGAPANAHTNGGYKNFGGKLHESQA